ncbi:hypothetical protein H9L39_08037, partial [Fusarium oxysporum f. sp. albedinis]
IAGPKRKEKKSDIVDDHDLTGFAPPHKTRAIISIVVAAENILLLLYAFMNEKSIRGVSIGSGKLALANLFPLFLFGSHEIILSISCLLLVLATVCFGVTGIHSLWRPYSMPNAILAVGIDDSLDMKEAVELKFRVPDSKHDFYIETSGTFYRAAYVAARDSGGRKNHGSLQYHGPFRAPLSPYIYLGAKLDIITTGSGIIEGFSCFRWRQRVAESENKTPISTRLVWLTTKSCPPYLSYYMNDIEVMGSKHVNSCSDSILNESIVLDKQDDDEKSRNEKNAHERNDINNNASLHSFQAKMTIKYEINMDMKHAIKKYVKEPSRRR